MHHPPLRIALISDHASSVAELECGDASGQNVYVAQIARCMDAAGHQVDVHTRRDTPRSRETVDVCPGMRVLNLNAGPAAHVPKERLLQYMSAFTDAALTRMCSVRYDVPHANFFMSGLVGLAMRERFGTPLVVTFHALGLVRLEHQPELDAFRPARIDIEHRLVNSADRLIAECPQDHDDLVRLYGASPERIATVPCGVDLASFAPGLREQSRRSLGLAGDEFVVLQLGRVVPRKDIDNVIRAVACMREGRRVRLLIVGGASATPDERLTPEIGRLRRISREYGVADNGSFLGHRRGVELCARPVVGSAVGGIKHSVVDGLTGYLVPPHDPAALARRLERLRDEPALARALGEAGARRVRERFTWQYVSDALLDVYASTATKLRQARDQRLQPVESYVQPAIAPPALSPARLAALQRRDPPMPRHALS